MYLLCHALEYGHDEGVVFQVCHSQSNSKPDMLGPHHTNLPEQVISQAWVKCIAVEATYSEPPTIATIFMNCTEANAL